MPKKVKYANANQPAMPGSIVKRQLVLSSQRAKVFQISRRFSTNSNGSHHASDSGVSGIEVCGPIYKVSVSNNNSI